MGLVDGYQADLEAVQETAETGQGQALGRYVQELEPAREGFVLDTVPLRRAKGAIDEARGKAVGVEPVYLVLHEGDQGRDDQGEPVETQRR